MLFLSVSTSVLSFSLTNNQFIIIMQGFRKVDPDRWEFANEGFLRGQKHLLRNITRRKPAHGQNHQQAQQPHGQSSSVGACVEVGKFGLEEEVERLQRDKNVLMQELVRLRQQQQTTDNQLQTMVQRLQGMEQRQQQMMSFLAKAVQSPGFFAQFVQQQNESNKRITEVNKKRRLKREGNAETECAANPDGRIVKYQPLVNEAAKAILKQIMKWDTSHVESFNKNPDDYMIGDASSSSSGMDSSGSSGWTSGVTLKEVSPASVQSSHVPAATGTQGHVRPTVKPEISSVPQAVASENVTMDGGYVAPSIPVSRADVVIPDLPPITQMVTGNILDIPEENYMATETDEGYMDPSLGAAGSFPIDFEVISPDNIDDLLGNPSIWDEILQTPVPEDIETSIADVSNGNEVQPTENGWNKTQRMDHLTEQMGLLSSDTKRV